MKLCIDRNATLQALLAQEDTDGSRTITIDDRGPRRFTVHGRDGASLTVSGTYRLGNLLQECWLCTNGQIDSRLINMPPLARMDHLMRHHYWPALTRRTDADGLLHTLADEKRSSKRHYLYVPAEDRAGLAYYRRISAAHKNIEVIALPARLDQAAWQRIEQQPGLLALKYDADRDEALPYVVPGGRFNEMYGWDSHFIALGLLEHGQYGLVQAMLENMAYQIRHYGKLLNANRSYYLSRSQPPFYTPCLRALVQAGGAALSTQWLKEHLAMAITEYQQVWMNPATRLTPTGLSRYFDEAQGRPRETEAGHFDAALRPYAERHGLDIRDFEQRYDRHEIRQPELDAYFIHDRSMRESGLDTTSRLVNCCASLACVDLNSILFRVESDIAWLIDNCFGGKLLLQGQQQSADSWRARAAHRQALMNRYLWDEAEGCFHDYRIDRHARQPFVSASNLLPLWAGCCSPEQAQRLVSGQLPLLMNPGGIASTGPLPLQPGQPKRQWDYPYGWAPHQIMIWEGLARHGYAGLASEAAFAWMQLLVRTAVDHNGLIPEKFDVARATHQIDAEYGNVGTCFEYLPAGGFGWTNSSFLLGLKYLDAAQRSALDRLGDARMPASAPP